MRIPFNNFIILLIAIVDFGKACDTSPKKKPTDEYGFTTQGFGFMSSDNPKTRPGYSSWWSSTKSRPVAVPCKGYGKPAKLVVKYSKTGLEHDFETCDAEAYLVKIPSREYSNIIRTKARCVADINGKKTILRNAEKFQVTSRDVRGFEHRGKGNPIVHEAYISSVKEISMDMDNNDIKRIRKDLDDYDIGLFRLSERVTFRPDIPPGCEKVPYLIAWVTQRARKLSANVIGDLV